MKGLSTVWLAALLAGAVGPASAAQRSAAVPRPQGGAAPLAPVGRVSNGAPHAAAASQPHYRAAVLMPQNGYYVAGTVVMTPYGSKSYHVSVFLQGLSEFQPYTVRVVYDRCASNPGSGTELATLRATTLGDGMSFNKIVPATALSSVVGVAVYRPGESKRGFGRGHAGAAQSCGELYQPTRVVHLHPAGHVHTNASGVALLKEPAIVNGNRVKRGTDVVIAMTGLARSAVQSTDIALGKCADKGAAVYPLLPLIADNTGHAVQGTGVTDMVPLKDMSVHIHLNTFELQACGDIG